MKKEILLLIVTSLSGIISATAQTAGAGVTDIDGNSYPSVIIGGQEWMAENLNTSRYNNGQTIPYSFNNFDYGIRVYYDNDSLNTIYGYLYNGYAVEDSRGLCPVGWHVPDQSEWQILSDHLGGSSLAGGKLKTSGTTHWSNPNIGATNESGFSGLPGGFRNYGNGFMYINESASFWTTSPSTEFTDHLLSQSIHSSDESISLVADHKASGASVRCLKGLTNQINPIFLKSMELYPNPATKEFTISLAHELIGSSYTITNPLGEIILSGTLESEDTNINLDGFSEGFYLVTLKEQGLIYRLIKN